MAESCASLFVIYVDVSAFFAFILKTSKLMISVQDQPIISLLHNIQYFWVDLRMLWFQQW